jgi:GNAT superfamily N-acetyltransferase
VAITITNTRPEHWQALEELQRVCFPTLSVGEWLRAEHFASHHQLFPQGQHVALDGDRPVAMSATFRCNLDLDHPAHTFHDIIAEGYFSNHDPRGPYLYGADISVHPHYRRQGVASRLYDARKRLVRALNLHGMIAGGMIPGYRDYRERMTVEDYVARVERNELHDPTLSVQLRNGFVVRGILKDYLHDEVLGNDVALIVWDNPERRSE